MTIVDIITWPWWFGMRMMREGDPDPSWSVIIRVLIVLAVTGFITTVIIARQFPREDRMLVLGTGMAATFFGVAIHPLIFIVVTIAVPIMAIFGLGCLFVYGLPKRAHPPTPTPLTDRAERIRQLERELEIGGD